MKLKDTNDIHAFSFLPILFQTLYLNIFVFVFFVFEIKHKSKTNRSQRILNYFKLVASRGLFWKA